MFPPAAKTAFVSFVSRLTIRERLAPYLAPLRGHSRRTWVLWAIGAILLVSLAEFQPSVLVDIYDPELLAGVVAFTSWLVVRRSVAVAVWAASFTHRLGCGLAPRVATATDHLELQIPPGVLARGLFVLPVERVVRVLGMGGLVQRRWHRRQTRKLRTARRAQRGEDDLAVKTSSFRPDLREGGSAVL